ncbi:MAG: glycosyltransferase [Waddliaceae bacterium]
MPKNSKIHQQFNSYNPIWRKLFQNDFQYMDYEYPKVSIIIPTYNCAQIIDITLRSLIDQEYPNFEIIIIDGGSTDRTLEVVKGFKNEHIHIHPISRFQRYEMLNKGITHSNGQYINCMFPGDFYVNKSTLRTMMQLALDSDLPSMVFCGTLLRDGVKEPKILYRHLTLKLLRRGQQPTSLQSCWIRSDVFEKIGKFNTHFNLRGGFDFMCRYSLYGGLRSNSMNHILTDYDLRHVTREMVVEHFKETLYIIWTYFGMKSLVKWLFIQKDFHRFFKLWGKSVQNAFLKK